jgi:hypothetical protein
MTDITLQRIHDTSVWQQLMARSPQGTEFLDPEFLSLFGVPYRLYGLFRGGVCIMGLPVIDARSLGGAALPWCYKQGPVFYDEIFKGAAAKRIQYEVELAELAVTELAKCEDYFHFSLDSGLTDVRGYDWAHYHDADKPRCRIAPRYTAILDLAQIGSESLRDMGRSARRQEERYAIEREYLCGAMDGTVEELHALYLATFDRQGLSVPRHETALFAPYVQHFLTKGIGHICAIRDPDGQAVAAAFVFRDQDNTWHVPIIGTGNTRYGGTLLYYQILDFALSKGAKAMDFDGANSPNRGYFKHSLGALPRLYFDVTYDAKAG